MRRANKMANKEYLRQKEWKNYEQARAQAIVNNPGFTVGDKDDNESIDNKHDEHAQSRSVDRGSSDTNGATHEDGAGPGEDILAYAEMYHDTGTNDNGGSTTVGLSDSQKQERISELEEKEQDLNYTELKRKWKLKYPDQTAKFWKEQYILGKINSLPWEDFENTSD